MTRDRTYMGMTGRQLGILAGLAVLVCFLLGAIVVLALRSGSRLFARSPQPAPGDRATPTARIAPTATLTETPTPVPYEQLIPYGWSRHQTQLIEIWMPPDFKKAAPGAVSGVAGSAVYLNLALVSSSSRSGYPASVAVSYEPLTADTLEAFLDVKLSTIPPDVNRAEQNKVSVNATEAYRLMFESYRGTNLNVNDLLYVFQDGGTVWYVKYSAEISEFYELLPYFEESIKTFRMAQ